MEITFDTKFNKIKLNFKQETRCANRISTHPFVIQSLQKMNFLIQVLPEILWPILGITDRVSSHKNNMLKGVLAVYKQREGDDRAVEFRVELK